MSLKDDIAKMQKAQREFLRKAVIDDKAVPDGKTVADRKAPPTLEDLLKKCKGNSAPAETPK